MPWLAAGAAASGIVGGILGGNAQKKAAAAQQAAIAAAIARAQQIIDEVGAPPDLSEKIILDQLAQVGELTPELEQQVKIGISKLSQLEEDRTLRDTQTKVLREIAKRGKAGLTPEERAQMNVARQDVQRDLEAKQQQIIQNLAMRGQAGSGAEIAARLQSSQESADRASEEADRISALASQRALAALQQEAAMSGDIRGQDFDVERTRLAAADEYNRFDVQNQMDINQRNVAAKNVSQAANLAEKQRMADTNKQMANQERYRQAQAKRDYWSDKMQQATAKANILMGGIAPQAQAIGNMGQAKANMWSGIGGGLSSGFGLLSNYYANQPKQKTYDMSDTRTVLQEKDDYGSGW